MLAELLLFATVLAPGGTITCRGDCNVTTSTYHSVAGPSEGYRRGVITGDRGGDLNKYRSMPRGRVVIDGPCYSACTVVLSKANVCATPRAVLGFHAGTRVDANTGRAIGNRPGDSEYIMRYYPARVRAYIASRGGLSGQTITVPGQQLLPACR